VEIAEAAAERDQIGVGQVLIPEQQHLMVEPRTMDRRERLVVDRAQVDVVYGCAEHGAGRPHTHQVHRSRLHSWGALRATSAASSTLDVGSTRREQSAPTTSSA